MEENEVRAVGDMGVPGKRPRGRPGARWMDGVRRDMQALRITPEYAQDRTFWKSRIRAADPHLVGKGEEEEVCFNGYHWEIKPLVTYSSRPPSQSVIGVCKDLILSHTRCELKLMA